MSAAIRVRRTGKATQQSFASADNLQIVAEPGMVSLVEGSAPDPALRAAERNKLETDVAAFLQDGGKIAEVPRSYRADPPRKPQNNYGKGNI